MLKCTYDILQDRYSENSTTVHMKEPIIYQSKNHETVSQNPSTKRKNGHREISLTINDQE